MQAEGVTLLVVCMQTQGGRAWGDQCCAHAPTLPPLSLHTLPPPHSLTPTHTHHPSDDDLDDADVPATPTESEGAVKVLTTSNFADTIKNNKFVLVGVGCCCVGSLLSLSCVCA